MVAKLNGKNPDIQYSFVSLWIFNLFTPLLVANFLYIRQSLLMLIKLSYFVGGVFKHNLFSSYNVRDTVKAIIIIIKLS